MSIDFISFQKYFINAFNCNTKSDTTRVFKNELDAWDFLTQSAGSLESNLTFHPIDASINSPFLELLNQLPSGYHRVATVVGFFSNAQFLVGPENDDEYIFFADRNAKGLRNKVYFYEARFCYFSNKPFSSIHEWIKNGAQLQYPPENEISIEGDLNPNVLSRRSNWLIHGIAGLDAGGGEFNDIPSIQVYEKEKSDFDLPHLCAYWLLHHCIAGNKALLEDALSRVSKPAHPWVQEVLDFIKSPKNGIGNLDVDFISKFAELAPSHAFAI